MLDIIKFHKIYYWKMIRKTFLKINILFKSKLNRKN